MYGRVVPGLDRTVTTADCNSARSRYLPDNGDSGEGGDGDLSGGRPGRTGDDDDTMSRCLDNPELCRNAELICTQVCVGSTCWEWECEYFF